MIKIFSSYGFAMSLFPVYFVFLVENLAGISGLENAK